MLLLSISYQLVRCLLDLIAVLVRRERTRPGRGPLKPPQPRDGPHRPMINLADSQVRRRPILDGLTSEYQIAA